MGTFRGSGTLASCSFLPVFCAFSPRNALFLRFQPDEVAKAERKEKQLKNR